MNRCIKFRIWFEKEKRWIHGPHEISSLDGVNLMGETILLGAFLDGVSIKDLNDVIALQFTGLLDKNGREIFEGDVIKSHEFEDWGDIQGYERIAFVAFKNGRFSSFVTKSSLETDYIGEEIRCNVEIIGNIYNNSDLLKP